MAGKKGSTQFAVSRRKMIAGLGPGYRLRAAFAGLEPQRSNHKAVVPSDSARYRSGPDSAAAFREDRL
jgi:hypothetical protein